MSHDELHFTYRFASARVGWRRGCGTRWACTPASGLASALRVGLDEPDESSDQREQAGGGGEIGQGSSLEPRPTVSTTPAPGPRGCQLGSAPRSLASKEGELPVIRSAAG